MSSSNSTEEKTEEPSTYRLKQARKEGEKIYSRELYFLLMIGINFIFLWYFSKNVFLYFYKIMINCLLFDHIYLDGKKSIILYLENIVKEFFLPFIIIILSITAITLILSMSLCGKMWSFKKIKFDMDRINLYKGLKKIFSGTIWIELCKILLRFILIMAIFTWYLRLKFFQIVNLLFEKSHNYLYHACSFLFFSILLAVLGLIPTVVLDVYLQYKSYVKRLKMSRYEIKEEFKQIEGNPQIKSRIRQEMKLRISRKVINDIEKANVIIINPIHYAVALHYNEHEMNAPKIVAKGSGYLAVKICSIGEKKLIPILRFPILTRALYKKSDVGYEIAEDFYIIVAEILAWIWKLKEWRKEGGTYPQQPSDLLDYKY